MNGFGRPDRLTSTPEQPAAGRRILLIACALIASGAVLRFVTLYSLDALLAAIGVSRHPPFPSMAWVVKDLAHTVADGTSTGILLSGMLLAVWHRWLVPRNAGS
jgi:uncharacterized membrane protein